MKTADFHHHADDGARHYVYRWLPSGPPRAVLQIVHGMAEHAGRYARFAEALVADGFAVYAQDLPGHGRTGEMSGLFGHLADSKGWQRTLDVIAAVRQRAMADYPELPVFLFGHSMGSFLAQGEISRNGHQLAGAILCATTGNLGPLRRPGMAMMRASAIVNGLRHATPLGEQLSFKAFNKAFAPNRTDFDWLSRDAAEVDKYVNDPHCGFRCTAGLWLDLLNAGGSFMQSARLRQIPKELPIMLIGGGDDQAVKGEAGPRSLELAYRKVGIKRVDLRIYPGARHELLNETCREQVSADIRQWLGNLIHAPRS